MGDEQSLGVGLVEATASFDKWWDRVESDLAAVTAKVAARAAFEAALAQSGNYVADKETSPSRVTFANGRVVAVSSAPPSEVKGDAGTARRGCGVPLWMDSEETCGDGGAGNWCSEACERGDAGTATVEQPAASGAGGDSLAELVAWQPSAEEYQRATAAEGTVQLCVACNGPAHRDPCIQAAIAAAVAKAREEERARCIQAAYDASADGLHDASAAACCDRIVAAIERGADAPGEGG